MFQVHQLGPKPGPNFYYHKTQTQKNAKNLKRPGTQNAGNGSTWLMLWVRLHQKNSIDGRLVKSILNKMFYFVGFVCIIKVNKP
jgi:hypothetical protein